MNQPLPRWRLALYLTAIAAAWAMLSNSDYNDARAAECAERSNKQFVITHNPATDRCEKGPRNGSSTQNR